MHPGKGVKTNGMGTETGTDVGELGGSGECKLGSSASAHGLYRKDTICDSRKVSAQ